MFEGFRKILASTDLSPTGDAAVDVALRMAGEGGAEVLVFHVLPTSLPVSPLFPQMAGTLTPDRIAELVDRAGSALEEHGRALAAHHPRVRWTAEVGQGEESAEIVRAAEERGCDLIVLGSKGGGGLKRMLLGSVAERVAHHAHCSVLVTRAVPERR